MPAFVAATLLPIACGVGDVRGLRQGLGAGDKGEVGVVLDPGWQIDAVRAESKSRDGRHGAEEETVPATEFQLLSEPSATKALRGAAAKRR